MVLPSGTRVLHKGKSRLFSPVRKIVTILDAFGIAISLLVVGSNKIDPKKHHATATCHSFPIVVHFLLVTPTMEFINGETDREIPIGFYSKNVADPLRAGMIQTHVPNYGLTIISAIAPVYVDFYEKHRVWIKTAFGGDPNAWPAIFNFARVLRNFISHSEGRVNFENPSAPEVRWHHLVYSPADIGKQVVGADFDIGDLLLFLFEFSDELDAHGCPL